MAGTFFINLRNTLFKPQKLWYVLLRWYKTNFLWQRRFNSLREPKVSAEIIDTPETYTRIISDLGAAGIPVKTVSIDKDEYERYCAAARYRRFPEYLKGGRTPEFPKKSLEHFLAAKLLGLNAHDRYIDVANNNSPVPEMYSELYGCTSYRQDLAFESALTDHVIGGNADNMPVANDFASAMALHCSFEHFEGGSDTGFIREAQRVLSPGGRVVIVPLYLFTHYAVITDPSVLPKEGIFFEPDATLHCLKGYGNRHGRIYDVPHFVNRIYHHRGQMNMQLFYFENTMDIDPSGCVRFAALLQKP
ncbi:MAG TPA: methyltransferase domain-containing protein [Chitinivibrionales bacterium]|nr:methyltransferase domain-containing protein [Chitinivibrionales bacterium]